MASPLRFFALVIATMLASAPVHAQDWDWQFAPYLWASGISGTTTLGPIERDVDIDFADIADVLDGAALIHIEGGNARHGVFGDLVWLSVGIDAKSIAPGDASRVNVDSTILEAGYTHKGDGVDVEFGLRYWDLDLEIQPALLPGLKRNQDWVDGFVGIRRTRPLSDMWSWTGRANIGAGGSDLSVGLGLTFGRKFRNDNQFVVGLKALSVDYAEDSVRGIRFRMDTTFFGSTIGYLFD
jgi:hypothetical protein